MTRLRRWGSLWPTDRQELLLQAALGPAEVAVASWRAWDQAPRPTEVDTSSDRLLPLVYRNLRGHGSSDTAVERLKGLYQATWVKNQLLFERGAEVLATFKEWGIPTLLFKGAPLALEAYKDPGARPMKDLDILVPEPAAPRCVRQLLETGWRPVDYPWADGVTSPSFYRARASVNLVDMNGFELDLHWRLFSLWPAQAGDDEAWSAARPFRLRGVDTLALAPTDMLVVVCVHGMQWGPTPVLRWIADASKVLMEHSSEIDPERMVRQAQAHAVVTPLTQAIRYLRHHRFAEIPPGWIEALESVGASRIDRLRYRALARAPGPIESWVKFWEWYSAQRKPRDGSPLPSPTMGLLEFFRYRWGASSNAMLGTIGLGKARVALRKLGLWTR